MNQLLVNQMQTANQKLVDSTQETHLLTQDLDQLQTHINKSFNNVIDAFGNESQHRRKMVDSFKNLSDMLLKCQENSKLVLPEDFKKKLSQYEEEIRNLQQTYHQQETHLNQQIQSLTSDLALARDKIFTQEKELESLKNKKIGLVNDNQELEKINTDYQQEISRQVSLFQKLSQTIDHLKKRIGQVFTRNKVQNHNIALYLPDTILAEIRHDVLSGVDFDFIKEFKPESNKKIVLDAVKEKIQQKWISQVLKIIEDLKVIQNNLRSSSPVSATIPENNPLWQDYDVKLHNFMKLWEENADKFVGVWIKRRNPELKDW